jgi:asparaginyl-tRNA synthetase
MLVEEQQQKEIPKPLDQLSKEELETKSAIAKVTTETLRFLTNEFMTKGFDWILPVVFSKSTDPLWPDPGASIEKRVEAEIYGETVRTTSSMIIHKLVACSTAYPKFFTLSPNVRIEKRERKSTGWHSYEFTQLDFEMRNGSFEDVKKLMEDVVSGAVKHVKIHARQALEDLDRYESLQIPHKPFEVFDRPSLVSKYGGEAEWEKGLIEEMDEPAWVRNIPREFYDYEDFETHVWDNYDLFVPGYGEILSGARREWQYDKISAKIDRDGVNRTNYALLLKFAKDGALKPSAGAGLGVERLVTWITGSRHIGLVQPFPKVPGTVYEL